MGTPNGQIEGEATAVKVEMIEGHEAWTRFQSAMKKVIAVPHAEIQRRIDRHREQAAKNPNKRGPKPKKSSVSPGPA